MVRGSTFFNIPRIQRMKKLITLISCSYLLLSILNAGKGIIYNHSSTTIEIALIDTKTHKVLFKNTVKAGQEIPYDTHHNHFFIASITYYLSEKPKEYISKTPQLSGDWLILDHHKKNITIKYRHSERNPWLFTS